MVSIEIVLAIVALVVAVANDSGRVKLWPAVAALAVIHLLALFGR